MQLLRFELRIIGKWRQFIKNGIHWFTQYSQWNWFSLAKKLGRDYCLIFNLAHTLSNHTLSVNKWRKQIHRLTCWKWIKKSNWFNENDSVEKVPGGNVADFYQSDTGIIYHVKTHSHWLTCQKDEKSSQCQILKENANISVF